MFEHGNDTISEHQAIGKIINTSGINEAIFCGEAMKNAYDTFNKGIYMNTKELLIAHLKENKFSNSTIND